MQAVDPITALIGAREQAQANAAGQANELGREDFLALFVAKLENQDPLSPSQDTEFVEQLAVFSSLEQLINANDNLETLSLGQASIINAQALDLIGQEALVESDYRVRIKGGSPDPMVYAIPQEAQSVTLHIVDPSNQDLVVRSFELETTPGGRTTLDWDGTDANGDPLADGEYEIQVSAFDLEGQPMSIGLFRSLPIDGVSFADGLIVLISGDQEISFESILEFRAGRS